MWVMFYKFLLICYEMDKSGSEEEVALSSEKWWPTYSVTFGDRSGQILDLFWK
jgi:hypothetical protein